MRETLIRDDNKPKILTPIHYRGALKCGCYKQGGYSPWPLGAQLERGGAELEINRQ